ncbi:MAG: FmdB family zinc ribbon protein [Mycobacteriales bacterium]
MPTYQYKCRECASGLEAVQSFTDAPLTECPTCGGPLRKVFTGIGVVFKGSGFYRNDSRAPEPSGDGGKDKAAAKSGSSKSDSSATSKSGAAAESTSSSDSSTKADTKSGSASTTASGSKPAASSGSSTTTKSA